MAGYQVSDEAFGGAIDTGGEDLSLQYRARQLYRALEASIRSRERFPLEEYLTPEGVRLFRQMSPGDQQHSLGVFRTLTERGWGTPELLEVALLHDVGKGGGRLRIWHRVLITLLENFAPGLLRRIAQDDPHSWRYPFFFHLCHAERGVALVESIGCSTEVVRLIGQHHTPPEGDSPDMEKLKALQEADASS